MVTMKILENALKENEQLKITIDRVITESEVKAYEINNLKALNAELLEALKALHAVVMQSNDRTIFDNGANTDTVASAAQTIAKAENL